MTKQPVKAVGIKKAMDLMHRTGTRLVRMCTDQSPEGVAYYLVPGGYVAPDTAEKIMKHPAVVAGADGLFPGHDQTWRVFTGDKPQE